MLISRLIVDLSNLRDQRSTMSHEEYEQQKEELKNQFREDEQAQHETDLKEIEDQVRLCALSGQPAEYQIGIAYYNKRKPERIIGSVAATHVEAAINNLMGQAFGSRLWPTVHDLQGNLLYHSYDADQKGISAAGGWTLQQQEMDYVNRKN